MDQCHNHTESFADSRLVLWICAVLLPLAALAYYSSCQTLQRDNDLWFHLAYGRHYVENLTWRIDHSMFSWTTANNPASYVTWIGSSVLYLTHKTMGIPGLFALHYLIFIASAGLIIWFARAAAIRSLLGLLVGLLMVAMTIRIAAQFTKPEMFSTFLITLTIVMYLRFRMDPKPWIMAAFPPVFLFWVNIHGLWQFGIVFLGLVFTIDLLLYAIRRNQSIGRKALIYLAGAMGFSFIAICVNPHGPSLPANFVWGRLSQVFSIFFANSAGGGEVMEYYRSLLAYQNMWPHLFFGTREHFYTTSTLMMLVMIIVLVVVWIISWKRSGHADLPVLTANVVFFLLGMFMGRLLLIFPLLWILSLIYLAWRSGRKSFLPRMNLVMLIIFSLLIGYIVFTVEYLYENPTWFGADYQDYIPDVEAQFIMDNKLPGPMFNDYLSGGYLMWTMYPEYKVFIDPRQFPYRKEVYPDYSGIGTKYSSDAEGLREFTDKYPVRLALIHHKEQHLIEWFQRSREWALVFFDKAAVVMVHKDVLPGLPAQAKAAMRSPTLYKDVDNPIVLSHLFNVYLRFLGTRYAVHIRNFYEQNVSDRFWVKEERLEKMDQLLEIVKQYEARRRK